MAKYEIVFTDDAKDDLAWFRKHEQSEIRDGIYDNLEFEPAVETKHRKRLRSNPLAEWQLSIDKFRVLYNVQDEVLVVRIEAVGYKKGSALYVQGEETDL